MPNLGASTPPALPGNSLYDLAELTEHPRLLSYGDCDALPNIATRTLRVGDVPIGGSRLSIVAGPALVTTAEDLLRTCVSLATLRQSFIRIDIDAIRGEERETMLKVLSFVRARFGLGVVARVGRVADVEKLAPIAECFELAAAAVYNPKLLRALGETGKTVFVTRDMTMTPGQFVDTVSWLERGGPCSIVLVERAARSVQGVRTLDASTIVQLQRETHFPIFVDCSDIAPDWTFVEAVAGAAVGAGADGLVLSFQADTASADVSSNAVRRHLSEEKFAAMVKRLEALRYTICAAAMDRVTTHPAEQFGR
ncbi:MAG: hypothetical protein IT290_01785 [Deltaproteobacteria bacterium]|nr:hypothetical protein [Deltaproteobacteria bacterium]